MNTRMKAVLDLLKQVRSEMHDNVDAQVTQKLDEAIEMLEAPAAHTREGRAKAKAALFLIGDALKYLPVIKDLFDSLM